MGGEGEVRGVGPVSNVWWVAARAGSKRAVGYPPSIIPILASDSNLVRISSGGYVVRNFSLKPSRALERAAKRDDRVFLGVFFVTPLEAGVGGRPSAHLWEGVAGWDHGGLGGGWGR